MCIETDFDEAAMPVGYVTSIHAFNFKNCNENLEKFHAVRYTNIWIMHLAN